MSHYFESPDGPERRREIEVTLRGRRHTLQTADGVFAGHRLDLATSVLLRTHQASPDARRLLDLGCGWGPIALALAADSPRADVDAVDVNDRALGLCADNAHAAGVADRVRPRRPEQVPEDVRYDEIWSNPPIRIGKEALHALLLQWLPRLAEDGVARLVVGRNLGADSLQRWLVEQGWDCTRTASAKGFRVLQVQQAPRPFVGAGPMRS